MTSVFRIGYVSLTTPDLGRSLQYFEDVIGGTVVEKTGQEAFISLGLDHHNIVLRQGGSPALADFGVQLRRGSTLDKLADACAAHGLASKFKSDTAPGISQVLEVQDLCGSCWQFYADLELSGIGFARRGVRPLRIGHIGLLVPGAVRLEHFLVGALGCHVTDRFDDVATFLTCNQDHHVFNIVEVPIAGLHHLAFELRDIAHVTEAADLLARDGIQVQWGPSRHTAGHNYAVYHLSPDGQIIEFYASMDQYLPDLGYFEPRPWHEHLPQRPQVWPVSHISRWGTEYKFDFGAS